MKIYEGEHHRRGFLEPGVDDSGVRALRLRKALPRLEMPCVRAAASSIGVRLDRLRVPLDAKRWAPGWKPQRWQEYYHTGPGFPVPHKAIAPANTNTTTPPYQ